MEGARVVHKNSVTTALICGENSNAGCCGSTFVGIMTERSNRK